MTGHRGVLASGAALVLLLAGCATTGGTPVPASTPIDRPPASTTTGTTADNDIGRGESSGTANRPQGRVFDADRVSQGVESVLTSRPPAGYGLTGVSDVQCPEDQPVEADTTFECTLKVDGEKTTVTITIINDDGLYEVNPPS